jgi:hypothetical protein
VKKFLGGWLFVKGRFDHHEMKDIGYDYSYEAPFITGPFMLCFERR